MYLQFFEVHRYTGYMRIPLFSKPQQERIKSMGSRLDTEIKYTAGNHYIFFDTEKDELVRKLKPDTPEYFHWLANLKSFHFSGKNGHFTARRESVKNKDGSSKDTAYWSAYRRFNKKQHRKYLGLTEKLTINALEEVAQQLETICTSQPPAPKTKRRTPEKREILYARIKAREETIEQKEEVIDKLEQKITDQEREIKELKFSIHQLEEEQKSKRERMEL